MKKILGRTTGGLADTLGRMQCVLPANPKSPLLARLVVFAVFLSLLGATVPKSSAQTYNLANGNSVVSINSSSQAGLYYYSVDGVNQAIQQWFWYNAGGVGGDSSIDTIGPALGSQSDARDLSLTYTAAQYSARVVYSLTGGSAGSGQSGLNETITFLNTSSSASLKLSFYDYSNFGLGGSSSGQTLQFGTSSIPPPPHYNSFTQMAGKVSLTTLVSSPTLATHIEAALVPQTLNELNSGSPTTLDDNPGPVSGNVTGTFEWDTTLAPNASLSISKLINITVVPEPSSALLLGLGLAAGAALARRAKRNSPDSNSNH